MAFHIKPKLVQRPEDGSLWRPTWNAKNLGQAIADAANQDCFLFQQVRPVIGTWLVRDDGPEWELKISKTEPRPFVVIQ